MICYVDYRRLENVDHMEIVNTVDRPVDVSAGGRLLAALSTVYETVVTAY